MTESEQAAAQRAPSAPPALALSFGDLAHLGRNDWWRYGLGIAGVLGGGMALALSLPLLLLALDLPGPLLFLRDPAGSADAALAAKLGAFALVMASVIAVLPFARLILPRLHRRPWRSFVTARARFAWGRAALSFACMLSLLVGALLLQLEFAPGSLRFSFEPAAFAAFAALSLVLVPLQVLAEELVFRGWLLQAVGRLSRRFALRAGVPAALFTLAHMMNPEISYGVVWAAAAYALAGLYLSILALEGGGLELPIGAHLATNLFVILIARPAISAVETPALFTEPEPALGLSVLGSAGLFALHYLLIVKLAPRARTRSLSV